MPSCSSISGFFATTLSILTCLIIIFNIPTAAGYDLNANVCNKSGHDHKAGQDGHEPPINRTLCSQTLSLSQFDDCRSMTNATRSLVCAGKLVVVTSIDAIELLKNVTLKKIKGTSTKSQCRAQCNTAIGNLKTCRNQLDKYKTPDNYTRDSINMQGSTADTNIEICQDEYLDLYMAVPHNITVALHNAKNCLSILLAISNRL